MVTYIFLKNKYDYLLYKYLDQYDIIDDIIVNYFKHPDQSSFLRVK